MCRKAWGFKSPLPHHAKQFNSAESYFTEFIPATAIHSGLGIPVIAICPVSDAQLERITVDCVVAVDTKVILS